jgi:histidine phosphotransferase ChpT
MDRKLSVITPAYEIAGYRKSTVGGKSDSLRLAELICARLCHDLAGPIGALLGLLEVVREQQPDGEEAAFAEETAFEAAQRLKLLRAAWSQDADSLDMRQLLAMTTHLAGSRKIRLDVDGLAPDTVFPPDAARMILNLVLLAAQSMPGGGDIALSAVGRGNVLLTISGPRAAWPVGFATWLVDETAAWEAAVSDIRNLQAALTALLARDHGFRVSMFMPAGAGDDMEGAPPLLVQFGTG